MTTPEFGAVNDDESSDKEAVRKAIAAAEVEITNGSITGAVLLFPKGLYRLNEASDMAGISQDDQDSLKSQSIWVSTGNFIIRGGGRDTNLYMAEHFLPMNPKQLWSTPRLFVLGEESSRAVGTVTQAIQAGTTKRLELSTTGDLSHGDWIELAATLKGDSKIAPFIHPYKIEGSMKNLSNGLELRELHQIATIDGNGVVLETPAIPDEFRSLTTTQHAEEAIKTHPHNLSTKIDLY